MSKRLLTLFFAAIFCVCLLAACGTNSNEPVEETSDLVFSDVKVECSNRDGFFGGRYANFTVTGSVTNKSGSPVNEDNMPKLITAGDGGEEIKADLSQDKLLDGETCDISYEHEFDITHDALPTLSFSCKLSTEGLEDAEKELNSGLGEVADGYASKDAEREAEKKAAEEKEQQEKEAAEQAKKAIEDCKGKTADEGLKAAKDANYSASFEDKDGVDVTDDVEDASNKSDVHKAKITEVEVTNFLGDYVTFTLDYEDPEAKKAREEEAKAKEEAEAKAKEEAEAEAKRKEEESKVLTVDNCEDLAKLLGVSDQGDPFIGEFAEKYDGRKIEFDAIVLDAQSHNGANKRLDILLMPGDGARGPYLKFEDVNAGYDMHWNGNRPDNITADLKLHCVAEVVKYNDNQQILFLDPVETSVR